MPCTRWSTGIRTGWPDSATSSTSRCRSSRMIPRCPGGMSTSTPAARVSMSRSRSSGCAPPNAPRSVTSTASPAFRAALIRIGADRHRFVLTHHHIVVDGWSVSMLLGEIFAGYYGQRLPAAGSYRRFVSWLADRDLDAARAAWREVLAGFDTPTLVGPAQRLG